MKIKDLSPVDRPREKLLRYGVDKLTTSELLAILLRTGTAQINVVQLANQILKTFPNEKILTAKLVDLINIPGVGETKACELLAMIELGQRLLHGKQSALLLSPFDVWKELHDIRGQKKEHFVVFFLDSRNQEIKREIISIGTINANLVHPREVFEPAIKHNAAQIIIAHNHPSGNPTPSSEDTSITRRLVEAGRILGIEVLDHVIVSKSGHISFRELGII